MIVGNFLSQWFGTTTFGLIAKNKLAIWAFKTLFGYKNVGETSAQIFQMLGTQSDVHNPMYRTSMLNLSNSSLIDK